MPIITVEGPKIPDLDTKRELARGLTEAASKAFSLPEDKIIIVLHEVSADCVATGGVLRCDHERM